jgi:hypothetical protein
MQTMITNQDAEYALDIVKDICKQVGPGLPATSQERQRAAILQKELERHLGSGHVAVEKFTLAPRAFVGSIPVSAVLMLLAALLNIMAGHSAGATSLVTAIASVFFSILSVLVVVFEFILGFEFIDPVFKKKGSINVVGTLGPGAGNAKRLLLLSGHHDSAPENTWFGLLGYGFLIASPTWMIGLIVMLAMSVILMTGLIVGSPTIVRFGTLGWVLMIYPILPSVIYGVFFNRGWKGGGTVPGAADNLSACAAVVAICRFLVNNPSQIPADTEIRFVSFGSEEAGYRGSRRYLRRHMDELKRLDARLLNFETIADPEITVLTSDLNNTVKNSPEMVQSVIAAAERAQVTYKVKAAGPGVANDSGPFSKAGIKATTLLGFRMPEQMLAFYHQKSDTPEVLTMEPLLNVLKLALEWVRCGGE